MNNFKFVDGLFKVISKRRPDVVSINFAHNAMRTLSAFARIKQYLPSVENLCFENNHIEVFVYSYYHAGRL